MKNDLTLAQNIKIGAWALLLIISSLLNIVAYDLIISHFSWILVQMFFIVVFCQFASLIMIYLVTLEKGSKGKRRSKR